MRAATFKKKYGDREFSPMEVGKAVICSIVYSRLKAEEQRAAGHTPEGGEDTLFTRDRVKAMLDTISTQDERMAYTAYRQLEEWLVTRQLQNATYKTLCKSFLNSLKRTVVQIIWMEEAEAELEELVNGEEGQPRDVIDNNVFLHKLDAARFAFDDSEESDIYSIRDNIAYTINRIAEYNALVRLIAKEIDLPELVGACSVNMDDVTDYIGRINDLIEKAQAAVADRGYTTDDNAIGAMKSNCFINYLKPFDSKPRAIPTRNRVAAQQLLNGLYVFMLPSGGLTLDRAIEGR